MPTVLTLDLPWVETSSALINDVVVRLGRSPSLAYDDGIVLDVQVVDPARFTSVAAVITEVEALSGPGRVVLVAGSVPLDWRAELRAVGVSFVDVSGVAEIRWPRVRVSARRFGHRVMRRRSALPLQKGHALVAQELLVLAADGSRPSIGELAANVEVSLPTASRAISDLEAHGLVSKHRDGTWVLVEVVDRVAIAQRLADRTAWPGSETLSGYLWGRTVFDVAARLSAAADRSGVEVALTGRTGAAYLGVLGSSSPNTVRAWVHSDVRDLAEVAEALDLDPAPDDAANVVISSDLWRVGVHGRSRAQFDDHEAWVAHPLRIWCDLSDEQRGSEYAAQMWAVVSGI